MFYFGCKISLIDNVFSNFAIIDNLYCIFYQCIGIHYNADILIYNPKIEIFEDFEGDYIYISKLFVYATLKKCV